MGRTPGSIRIYKLETVVDMILCGMLCVLIDQRGRFISFRLDILEKARGVIYILTWMELLLNKLHDKTILEKERKSIPQQPILTRPKQTSPRTHI
jgi:hypothetical protein